MASFILDARQILPQTHYQDPNWVDERPLNNELVEDLSAIFNLLLEQGANIEEVDKKTGNNPSIYQDNTRRD